MHRTVLLACLPCLIALAASFILLWVLVRLSRAKFNWRRLRELHRCQEGGIQSLSFILTMPLFICVVQFIVQVSQLMIGVMVVNYSAYAGARAAAVWIPANVGYLSANKMEDDSVVYGTPGMTRENSILLSTREPRIQQNHPKYRPIFKAVALALMPAAPSRNLGLTVDSGNLETVNALHTAYAALNVKSQQNARINPRLDNKFAWAWQRTRVRVSFVDKDAKNGPTYNPDWIFYRTDPITGQLIAYNPYDPYEVGWQDPVTVQVTHDFALLPGPGRVLAKYLVGSSGQPDLIADQIQRQTTNTVEQVYSIPIWASATATVEGLKSVVPYVELQ